VTFVNPEPLPFADVIAAGEGEVLVPAFERAFRAATGRADLLRRLAQERGFYVPTFYEPQYGADGGLSGFATVGGVDAPLPVRKAALKTTEAIDPPSTSIFTPDTEFGSRFLVEVVRGCANLCRFCWAGYNYLPVRAFPTDRILELAEAARVHANRVGLVSIALCDHPDIERILARLLEMGYAISPASLRLDDLTESIVRVLRASGERTVTIAPETGSDRMRRVINTTVTNGAWVMLAATFDSTLANSSLTMYVETASPPKPTISCHPRLITLLVRERMMKHARVRRPGRAHRRQREPSDPQARHRVSVAAHGRFDGHRQQDQAAAQPDGRHRQRVLQHQVRAALVLSGAAVAWRSSCRAGHRSGRAQRPKLARGGR
jgi:hypothetical protein